MGDNKSEDKKDIELEEKEKILNEENKAQDSVATIEVTATEVEASKPKTDNKEGREVQPKKIPIGGIQMPGFFTRSKSKEKCKEAEGEQVDAEGAELLTSNDKTKEERTLQQRLKIPNPFKKSKTVSTDDDVEKSAEPKERKSILSLKIPSISLPGFPNRKKDQNLSSQSGVAGLASMETLDENDKSADKKEDEMKNVSLEVDEEKKELEKQAATIEPTWKQKLKTYRVVLSAVFAFILLLLIIILIAIPDKTSYTVPVRDGRYVETVTTCGKVEGILEDGAVAFRGIPYARPPVGQLRFKPAQPLNSIDYCWNGTLVTHNATDYCLQIYSNGTVSGVEDCLTLDVVTPYVRYDTPLPVIVLIGAESLIGGSPGKMRPSSRYARSRDVIFVRPNFRLGVLGFLSLDVLSRHVHPPTSGNYGLSDIVQALRWIQLNIQHFGGDANAVTLFGHRAGATLVTALATTKGASKLFKQAWASSGGAIYPGKLLTESETDNRDFLSAAQCEDSMCLIQKDAQVLVNSLTDTWRKEQPDLPLVSEEPSKRHQWLVLDGKYLQDHPGKVWANETGLPVPLVLGTTAHAAASEKLFLKHKVWTEALVKQHINESKLGQLNLTEDVLSMYAKTYQGLSSLISDIRTVCPLLAVSTQMRKVPFYVVTQGRGERQLADVDSDVDAIFGRYEPKTVEQRRYVTAMQQLFYYYVSHGVVKHAEEHPNKILVIEQDVLPASNYTHCDYWIQKDIVPRYAQLD